MTKYHLYDGTTVKLPNHSIILDFNLLNTITESNIPRRGVGRIITAVISWLNGELSPDALKEREWYFATLLYKDTSASLSKCHAKTAEPAGPSELERIRQAVSKQPARDEEEVMENMVREARRTRKEKQSV